MFQTFTGSSRRPRQVDLSGRKANPWSTGLQGGPQQALQGAQNDRKLRQRQREELAAAKVIQRVWRGHRARLQCADLWRDQWDSLYQRSDGKQQDALTCHRLLVSFAQSKDTGDVRRVLWAHNHLQAPHQPSPWPLIHKKTVIFCLRALARLTQNGRAYTPLLLDLVDCITSLISADRQTLAAVSDDLYKTLFGPVRRCHDVDDALINLVKLSLLHADQSIYRALVQHCLTCPLSLDVVHALATTVDPSSLLTAAASVTSDTPYDFRRSLWLLGNLAHLMKSWPQHTAQGTRLHSSAASIQLMNRLLGAVAEIIDAESEPLPLSNDDFDQTLQSHPRQTRLNSYLRAAIHTLIDEGIIRRVFGEFSGAEPSHSTDLATYVLTLLRVFYAHSDDIRMWLYLGPQTKQDSSAAASPIAFFWQSARQSFVVQSIMQDPREAIRLITYQPSGTNDQSTIINDWKSVLMFLELYTFILKLMDDEEFLGHARQNTSSRLNPLSVSDNADLVVFLKHLGFAMSYHARSISDAFNSPTQSMSKRSLGSIFGVVPAAEDDDQDDQAVITLAGLPGVSLDYVKGIVTGLVRAIYERDSRRPFLPKNHWLMTSEFDMSNFITDVVAEEENRHQLEGADEDDEEAGAPVVTAASGHRRLQQYDNAAKRLEMSRKASRKRYLETVAPRLEILQHMPFLIPFDTRVQIFRQFVRLDQSKRRNGFIDPDMWRQSRARGAGMELDLEKHSATVRRKHEFRDSMDHFWPMGESIKEPIQITFVDDFGIVEPGIDGGGVTKEFLTSAVANGFSPGYGLFQSNDQHLLHPNPTAMEELRKKFENDEVESIGDVFEDHVRWMLNEYEYAGRLIGKCLYEGILVDISFTGFFLRQWALATNLDLMETAHRANINDLRDLDEGLYQGLLSLKNYQGNVEDLALTFSVTDEIPSSSGPPQRVERELVPNGRLLPVTNQNRLIYISRVARYRLQEQSHRPTTAFLRGLSQLIQPSWLAMFNQSELQNLVGGAASSINVDDLRRNTVYGGLYVIGDDGLEHPCVQRFWAVMHGLADEDKGKVLKFVTSTPRAPLLGFASLTPPFCIRDSRREEGGDEWFPTSSTCVNLLKLPRYSSAEALREKLLYAVNSGAGFDLS